MIAPIDDLSHVAATRRAATEFAERAGFDAKVIGRIALAVTEMATNILRHAGRGEMAIARFDDCDGRGLELLALDRGPGIADPRRAVEDGFSTAGGAGTGLGAIRRQADRFVLWSHPGCGTAVLARFGLGAATCGAALGAVVEPIAGESDCGDRFAHANTATGPTVLMVDGSGHGTAAAVAASAAATTFLAHVEADAPVLLQRLHQALAHTRGAAVAVARVDRQAGVVRFAGIGNICGAVVAGANVKRMVSLNGIIGHVVPRVTEFTYPWQAGAAVILHSDGLSAKWDLGRYPGLAACHPSIIAGVLFRDHRRRHDDAGIVVMRAA